MKRTPLNRYTSLQRSSKELRRTRIRAVSDKRRADTPTDDVLDAVRRRSGGKCEICRTATATQFHHRKPRSAGGKHTVENLLHVCGFGNTSGCHGRAHSDPDRYTRGWLLHSWDDPADFSTS